MIYVIVKKINEKVVLNQNIVYKEKTNLFSYTITGIKKNKNSDYS